jgi:hypothetical protein
MGGISIFQKKELINNGSIPHRKDTGLYRYVQSSFEEWRSYAESKRTALYDIIFAG